MMNEEAIKIFKEIREELIAKETELSKQVFENLGIKAIDLAIKALEQARPKGKWIVHPKGIYAHLVCSKCLSNAPYDCKTNYCPNCGADMRGDSE